MRIFDNFKMMKCLLRVSILLVIVSCFGGLASSVEAQRRGGFGGGRSSGGFSSGRSSGGFGGGTSFRPSGGGFRPGPGPIFIGGPRVYFFGGSGGAIVLGMVLLFVVIVVGTLIVANVLSARYAILNMGINLRRGDRYSNRLDALVDSSDFTTPQGRIKAFHQLVKMIEEEDVIEGFIHINKSYGSPESLSEKAETLARSQMNRVGIQPDAVNVSNADGQSVKIGVNPGTGDDRSDACVVAFLVTIRAPLTINMLASSPLKVATTLARLYETTSKDIDAIYFYYAPNKSVTLSSIEANRLFADLKATAERSV